MNKKIIFGLLLLACKMHGCYFMPTVEKSSIINPKTQIKHTVTGSIDATRYNTITPGYLWHNTFLVEIGHRSKDGGPSTNTAVVNSLIKFIESFSVIRSDGWQLTPLAKSLPFIVAVLAVIWKYRQQPVKAKTTPHAD